ncbi:MULTISPECIES: dienelactone hydrolase family protein [Streptacidiphilus]|uniref:Dienelactone hydrolase family protein n=1 Tax=Streptacidiphilus cavernicola TaxID=3342716 RepID=A0ABV6UHP3_9ACTN|nr:dienelactone hydrolase family protein [Streptacidiphilus jeojiense]
MTSVSARPVPIRTEHVTVPVGVDDSAPMGGYLARPDSAGVFPAVLVAMELFGVDSHVRDVCDHLAGLGFVALAPDFHHRTDPGVELPREQAGRDRGFELLQLLTRDQVLADVGASIDFVYSLGSPRVGMVGLSMGGHIAYLAATEFDLDAVAVFYGGWLTGSEIPLSRPEPTLSRTGRITGRLLYLVGADDHVISTAEQQAIASALKESGVRHEFVTYPDRGHGFLGTDPDTADDAWSRVHALLATE